jgi:hypothetical protein
LTVNREFVPHTFSQKPKYAASGQLGLFEASTLSLRKRYGLYMKKYEFKSWFVWLGAPIELPSEFSPDLLTEVIQNGAKELLRTAIHAEVSSFIAEHAHLLDEAGRQRLGCHAAPCCMIHTWGM